MMNKTLLLLTVLLAGCASTADIDTNKVDSDCAHSCSANYSNASENSHFFRSWHNINAPTR
jgi:hypothetical protein